MNKQPKVSVIIPAYNAMKYLPETVESVLKQTLTDFELLIVNDGSTDNIVEWASQLTDCTPCRLRDRRVRLISQINQGTAIARNQGIIEAKGEYIALLDADDIWEATKLEKQAKCLDNNPAVGLVDTWAMIIDENGNATGRIRDHEVEGDVYHKVYEACDSPICCGSSPMIRRSCFDVLGLFDRDIYAEDVDMWIRIASRYHYGLVKEVLVRYRQHPNNKSRDCQSMLEAFRTLIEKTYSSLPVESLYLRAQCYGRLNMYLAWRAMETKDYRQAAHFRSLAIAHHPKFRFVPGSIRLLIAVTLIRLFGADSFDRVRAFNRSVRRFRSLVVSKMSIAS
ncbi:MAG: glycosyltransferase family 2 protein [Xenococcaceae cyanobacterium]